MLNPSIKIFRRESDYKFFCKIRIKVKYFGILFFYRWCELNTPFNSPSEAYRAGLKNLEEINWKEKDKIFTEIKEEELGLML